MLGGSVVCFFWHFDVSVLPSTGSRAWRLALCRVCVASRLAHCLMSHYATLTLARLVVTRLHLSFSRPWRRPCRRLATLNPTRSIAHALAANSCFLSCSAFAICWWPWGFVFLFFSPAHSRLLPALFFSLPVTCRSCLDCLISCGTQSFFVCPFLYIPLHLFRPKHPQAREGWLHHSQAERDSQPLPHQPAPRPEAQGSPHWHW